MLKKPSLFVLSEQAICLKWDFDINPQNHHQMLGFSAMLDFKLSEQISAIIPAYNSITLIVNEDQNVLYTYKEIASILSEGLDTYSSSDYDKEYATWEIPVYYGGEYGPDLSLVAEHNKLSISEVIQLHTQQTYYVYMIGFTAGFPYLGGISEQLFTPRRNSPRLNVAAGSVGIGGEQTGVYPFAAPGGWQIIGKTAFNFFSDTDSYEAVINVGDTVRFKAVEG